MRETSVEDFACQEAERRGGTAEKWGVSGWADRIVILPGNRIGFLELKRPGKRTADEALERRQKSRARALGALGCLVGAANTFQGVVDFLDRLASTCPADIPPPTLARMRRAMEASEASQATQASPDPEKPRKRAARPLPGPDLVDPAAAFEKPGLPHA